MTELGCAVLCQKNAELVHCAGKVVYLLNWPDGAVPICAHHKQTLPMTKVFAYD